MSDFWKAKLIARIHDPAEKALVLMRDRGTGHEDGSLAALRDELELTKKEFDRRSDWMAAGADRPKWPDETRHTSWSRVIFANDPVLIHPLDGTEYKLNDLSETQVEHLKAVSFDHFKTLIEKSTNETIDYQLTHLAFWRFGFEPELCAPELGGLWQVLPADTRIPDHSIWQHLDITSALAGALHNDMPALLTMSFGPVQAFIEQARSTSDLWAGSHLLSSLVWEGMKPLCKELGPDAVLFPNLRGLPAVDRWILETVPENRHAVWRERFTKSGAVWLDKATDENPLFAATLPNKFVAIVPSSQAERLAGEVRTRIREKSLQWAKEAAHKLFGDPADGSYLVSQIEQQVCGFPEAYFSIADWPVAESKSKNGPPVAESVKRLRDALACFYPESKTGEPAPGLFGTASWKVLDKQVDIRDAAFYEPGAGILYPAVYDLGDRSLGAAKSFRPFDPLSQTGYRCTLCGEREWLTGNVDQLNLPPGRREKENTRWTELAGSYGIKKGEHLCAICTLKRMWPTLFRGQLEDQIVKDSINRFVVSTHAMALAPSLSRIAGDIRQDKLSEPQKQAFEDLRKKTETCGPVPLPKKLARELSRSGSGQTIRRIPDLLDRLREADDEDALQQANKNLEDLLGSKPETYYALLLMDGDHMGAWISGTEPGYQISYLQSFHPKVRAGLANYRGNTALKAYLDAERVPSPARHSSISTALNNFSSTVVRHVIEECFYGRLIYSGGDDVLAMLPVDNLMPAMSLLRCAYSGAPGPTTERLELSKGYARVDGRLMMMMGSKATASIGAVVAHHQAPLRSVLRDLRQAERDAKSHGRNAFSIRILKRAGGEIGTTGQFSSENNGSLQILVQLAGWLREKDVSRRAVYHSVRWLREMPPVELQIWKEIVSANLPYQMGRQSEKSDTQTDLCGLACNLVQAACKEAEIAAKTDPQPKSSEAASSVLQGMLETAEFFAREARSSGARK